MANATSAAQAKSNIVSLLSGAERASGTAQEKVKKAGVPDVDGGADIARKFVDVLSGARDSYGRARRSVDSLPTTNATHFYDGVVAAMDQLNKQYDQSTLDTDNLSSTELQQAFDEAPECA